MTITGVATNVPLRDQRGSVWYWNNPKTSAPSRFSLYRGSPFIRGTGRVRNSGSQAVLRIASLAVLTFIFVGCATVRYEKRPFFLPEQGRETHGRKTWFDHLVEFDPGKIRFQVADDYAQNPPRHIAVLPFVDEGSASFVVNKIPLSFRNQEEKDQWAWTYANRLRRSLTGYLAQREFSVVNLFTIDTVLADNGIKDWAALQAVSPAQLGRWLNADTVVYGEVIHYESYYAFLLATWQIGVRMRMVSTHDGHEIFSAEGDRYSVDLRPAFTMMDMGINSALTLLQLRDVVLARAEEDVSREVVLRLPIAEHNVATLIAQASSRESDVPEQDQHAAVRLNPRELGQ